MAEPTALTLNHFALVAFRESYWRLAPEDRQRLRCDWLTRVQRAARVVHLYQTFGLEARNDLIVWSALEAEGPDAASSFFGRWAEATAPMRAHIELRDVLWGFTRQSQYTKTKSQQELNPFALDRLPYLIVYPFVKTTEWYLRSRDERQAMMAGHIKVGKQYKDISQLLLYSFGLQDQEFVVVYETGDLTRFMELVNELRSTEARRYTARDWPLHTGVYQPGLDALSPWL
ncbi:MAG TPA: chlorite dismutase family protein [Gemmatimonadales bacterium]|nr:chlorite dismutase family protein [Gemmatimonadales bacterium]